MAQASAAQQRPGSTRTLLKGVDGAGTVRRTVLPGGLRVVTETLPTVRSATFGIWVGVGSRDETPALNGATHYLEHLLFKGTARRNALEISAALDAVGGEMNAFTAKENTCYYARVLDTDLPLAIDVVCDMLTGSLIRPEDVEAERGVILEEMAMAEDDPGDVVHDLFAKVIYGDSPLGRPILGTQETVTGLTGIRSRASSTAGTSPSSWSSRQRGTWTTPGWSRWSRRPSRRCWRSRRATPPRSARASARSVRPAGSRCSTAPPSRPTWCSASPACRGTTNAAGRSAC